MKKALLTAMLAWLAAGCLDTGTVEVSNSEDQDLVSPFSSQVTGYVSDGALELDATFEGIMELPLFGEANPQQFVADLRAGRGVAELAVEHMRFSHRPLLPAKLRINLANAGLEWYQVEEIDGKAQLRYRLTTEALVTWKDLEADNVGATSLVGRTYNLLLPADPRKLFDRVGETCSRELDDNDKLNDFTYFYYYDSANQSCQIENTWATLTLDRLHIPLGTYYPEYHRLTADNKITVAIFFDGASSQPAERWDQSTREFIDLQESLVNMGFGYLEDLSPVGARYSRTRSGIEQIIDMVGPTEWSAMEDTHGAFQQAMLTHEVIAYQGHAFIGQLPLFNRSASYPSDTYQIFFLGSCWGYHFFVNQILSHKATTRDPTGWELTDVVAATERPYFSNGGDEIRIMLTNVLKGAETGGTDDERRYDWGSITDKMNRRVEEWYEVSAPWIDKDDSEYYMKEIYGVSGVTTNCYDPRDPQKCGGCSDNCPQNGQTRCQDNGVSTCANHDNDSCLEWGEIIPCKQDESCLDGSCLASCTDDAYEDNDTPDTASDTSGDLGALQICEDDDDWYQVSVEAGDTLVVEILFAHQAGDLDLEVYGPSDLEAALAVSQSSTDNERISLPVESTGDYFINVYGYASSENAYRMTVSLSEGGQDCQDECYQEGQRECLGNGYQVCGAGHDGDDCLEWGPVISCNGYECLDGYCQDDGGETDPCYDECSMLGDRQCAQDGYQGCGYHDSDACLEWGTVISCEGLACDNGRCVEETNDCTDDAYENNDSRTNASAISDGSYDLLVCANDDDWYRIDLQAGDQLEVSIAFTHSQGDLDLDLTDEAGTLIQSSTSTNNAESVADGASASTSFYVRVYGYSGAQNSYTLSVAVDSPVDDICLDDQFEQNDDLANAYQLSSLTWGPNSFPCLMLCADDEDWFAVSLYANEILTVNLAFAHALGDIDIKILDENQQVLASGITSDDNEYVEYETDEAQTVYLKIYGFDAAENIYDMLVTVF